MQLSLRKTKLVTTRNYTSIPSLCSPSPMHQPSLPITSHPIASQGFSNPLPVLSAHHHHHHLMQPSPWHWERSLVAGGCCLRADRDHWRGPAQHLHWMRSCGRHARNTPAGEERCQLLHDDLGFSKVGAGFSEAGVWIRHGLGHRCLHTNTSPCAQPGRVNICNMHLSKFECQQ